MVREVLVYAQHIWALPDALVQEMALFARMVFPKTLDRVKDVVMGRRPEFRRLGMSFPHKCRWLAAQLEQREEGSYSERSYGYGFDISAVRLREPVTLAMAAAARAHVSPDTLAGPSQWWHGWILGLPRFGNVPLAVTA